jgi:hypothetical protein
MAQGSKAALSGTFLRIFLRRQPPSWDHPIWDTPYCAYLIGPRELASYAMG